MFEYPHLVWIHAKTRVIDFLLNSFWVQLIYIATIYLVLLFNYVMSSISIELEEERKAQKEEREKKTESSQYPNKRRNMLVSGMVALTAMVGYAFMSGLVQVQYAS